MGMMYKVGGVYCCGVEITAVRRELERAVGGER